MAFGMFQFYAVLLVAAAILLVTVIFQWLWNNTMPEVFGLKRIRFWIAFRLLLMAALLTSGSVIPFGYP